MPTASRISGLGIHLPDRVRTTEQTERELRARNPGLHPATGLIRRMTGVRSVHVKPDGWQASDLAVAAALEGRVLGAPCAAVLSGVCYASVATLIAAAMKLLRLGQNGAQSLLTEALAAAPELIAAAESTPREEIGWFNPWLDIGAARHEHAEARMFIS